MLKRIALVTTVFAASMFSGNVAFAAGESDDTPACKSGMIYSKAEKKCVPDEKQSNNDEMLIDNAKALAYASRFDEAMSMLTRVQNKNTAQVQNYLGYVSRNLGDVDGGLEHYRMAIALNPNYTLARSYMGQALLLKGDRRGAMMQLDEIANRAGSDTPEYVQLAQALLGKSLQSAPRY